MLDWNDLRYFIAVAEAGSTLAAGRNLGVSQTTVARRLAALDEALGLTLFERRASGYALTADGAALLDKARAVGTAVDAFASDAASHGRDIGGIVRLSTSEVLAVTMLPPILRDLHAAHRGIRIDLDTSDEVLDLAAGAADIAVRTAKQLKGAGLVARRIGDNPWEFYCSRDYADAHGRPMTRRALVGHPLIGGGGEHVGKVYRQWLDDNGFAGSVVMEYNSVPSMMAAVRAGLGLGIVPRFAAAGDPDLLPCLPPSTGAGYGLYLVTHERVRHAPRVRAVMDFLAERLAALAREGEARVNRLRLRAV